jgi:hypothetical protein
MTSGDHNKYLTWAFLAFGIIQVLTLLLASLFIFFFLTAIPVQENPEFRPQMFFGVIVGVVILIQLVMASPLFIASYALWKRKSWAKAAAIVGGIVASLHFPLGTALCAYAFWFMFGDSGKELYGRPKDERYSGYLNLNNQESYAPPPQPPNLWE